MRIWYPDKGYVGQEDPGEITLSTWHEGRGWWIFKKTHSLIKLELPSGLAFMAMERLNYSLTWDHLVDGILFDVTKAYEEGKISYLEYLQAKRFLRERG
jgi:hypothetical protein